MRSRRAFSREFKSAAVERLRTERAGQVARSLEISISLLHRWRRELDSNNAASPQIPRKPRKFSKEFKQDVVVRLKRGEPLADVARSCDVNRDMVRRWWREEAQFGGEGRELHGGPGAQHLNVRDRRTFSRDFKHAAVVRLKRGEPLADVAQSCDVNRDIIRRWWREETLFGDYAFSGYGNSRSPDVPAQAVVIRLTAEEYGRLQQACAGSHAGSLPDFARSQLLQKPSPSLRQLEEQIERLTSTVSQLASPLTKS